MVGSFAIVAGGGIFSMIPNDEPTFGDVGHTQIVVEVPYPKYAAQAGDSLIRCHHFNHS